MTREQQAVRRSGTPRPVLTVLLAALAVATWVGIGCAPSIPSDAPAAFVELEFDPSATPPKSFEPTILTTNEATQLLDFSVAGIEVPADPADCQTQTALPLAACEFYWYLEQLDGFPTVTPGRTPVSAPIDMASVTMPDNLFVYEFMRGQSPLSAADFDLSYDDQAGYLKLDPKAGWEIGGLYLVGVRGYANGIKDTAGNPAVASVIYVLLKQDQPLACGATTIDEVEESCEFYQLFAGDPRFSSLSAAEMKTAIGGTLLQLEDLRLLFKGQKEGGLPFNVWDVMADKASMPPEEVAILWAFRTHTASVIELNPDKGMVPVIASPTEIRLKVKGPLEADTLKAFSTAEPNGTVFVLDATAFLGGDIINALPEFTPTYADGDVVITMAASMVEGHQYIVVVSNEVEGKPGVGLVPSPVTVALRTRGELVDDFALCAATPTTAKSMVSSFTPDQACELEAGRQQFLALLDNATVMALTTTPERPTGLTREIIAYLVGFEYVAQ